MNTGTLVRVVSTASLKGIKKSIIFEVKAVRISIAISLLSFCEALIANNTGNAPTVLILFAIYIVL